ncbi:MAG: hypothetical protein K2H09_05855, partial [Treponemataceae bacterium]|nr:hypothetical protein [Treponemataceae bacterium]
MVFSGFHTVKKSVYKDAVSGFLPRTALVPLRQECGAECRCLVGVGDVVQEGQLIAASAADAGRFASCVHAPIPGKVVGMESCTCPDGRSSDAVRIALGGTFSFLGKRRAAADAALLSAPMLLRDIAAKGVLNTFEASKPELLAAQLASAGGGRRLLVVRLFDEDVSRLTDSLAAKLFFDKVFEGALISAKAMAAAGVIFAVPRDFSAGEWEGLLSEPPGMRVPSLYVSVDAGAYPSGHPKELAAAVRKASKEAPFSNACASDVYTDASTMLEVCRTVKAGMPVIDRYVHVSGSCLHASGFIKVCIGTTLRELAEQCGGFRKWPAAIIVNGLVCGMSAGTLDAPVAKYVKSVLFLPSSKSPDQRPSVCVRCGNCRRACPRGLSPDILYRHITGMHLAEPEYAASAALCVDCGLCNYVCPARLPICQEIRCFQKKTAEGRPE